MGQGGEEGEAGDGQGEGGPRARAAGGRPEPLQGQVLEGGGSIQEAEDGLGIGIGADDGNPAGVSEVMEKGRGVRNQGLPPRLRLHLIQTRLATRNQSPLT